MIAASRSIPRRRERGIALVSALLTLTLVTVLAVSYMAVTVTERSVSSNVHVAKGSLYAADAGTRAAAQELGNLGRAKLDSLISVYSGSGPIITQPALLFPSGDIVVSATSPRFDASATIVYADSVFSPTLQAYDFHYTVTSEGEVGLQGTRRVQASGVLRLSASRGSFADYLIFTDVHTSPAGTPVWFNSNTSFDGRVHTNGELRFAYQPTFGDLVSSVNSKAWFNNNNSPIELASTYNGSIDVPNFYGGFQRGVTAQTLPTDANRQQNAALGLAVTGTAPSNTTINSVLGTGAGSSTPPNGIYVPNSGGAVVGGIYVQGTVSNLALSIDGSGRQVYTVTQGATTKTITVDRVANQTLVQEGATNTTYAGVPLGSLYVRGRIDAMRGPARVSGVPQPGIAVDTRMMVTATDDIIFQNDILSQNYAAASSVLGVFSSGGDLRVGSSAPNDMCLDAFLITVKDADDNGEFKVDGYSSGSPRGTFHLRGGAATSYYGAFGTSDGSGTLLTGYARDFRYDSRGLIPPYYPGNTSYTSNLPTTRSLAWREL